MKILTAHQPAYLPWLGYLHKIALADKFIVLDDVQFEKNSFVNRNRIKTSNGPAWLTIPLEMKGHMGSTVGGMRMDMNSNWPRKHWNSLLMNYKKAPHFSDYADFFEAYYSNVTDNNMLLFIQKSTNYILSELKVQVPTAFLSGENISGKKQELIAELCLKNKADTFVFGSQGKEYADPGFFAQHGIQPYFQEYVHPQYPQLWGEFVPFLSVIDAMFNLGSEKTRELIWLGNISRDQLAKLTR